jgi:DNA-binding transcriptional MerR regulator
MSARTVSQVARLAHVTVRTLHHYDEIGLLVPSDRSSAGYRLYSDADLARLHEILVYRELGFTLDAIAQVMSEPPAERRASLLAQRERLIAQKHRTEAVLRALDIVLTGDTAMPTETRYEGIDQFDHAQYEDEARERWGDTPAYAESQRRVKSYTKDDWAAIKAEGGAVLADFAALFATGAAADSTAAMDVAERARLHIDRWFYPCARAMHAQLGEMYVADPRFTAFYDAAAPGLAVFVRDAIQANAKR